MTLDALFWPVMHQEAWRNERMKLLEVVMITNEGVMNHSYQ
jgi:hypothetical protein